MKNFQKAIENIARRYDTSQVFDDFLTMAVCAYAMGRMEKEYEEAAHRYNQEEKDLFGTALAAMIIDYQACSDTAGSWDDVLGNYYETINSASHASRSGQFFTPKTVCDMMAMMVCGDAKAENINDPSCGSSRNLIAHCRLNSENRLNCFYTGNDLDRRCVKMSVLNFIMYGMKGVVIHMNTLSLEIFGGYRIYLPETGLGIQPLTVNQCNPYVFGTKNEREQNHTDQQPIIIKSPQSTEGQQLTIF